MTTFKYPPNPENVPDQLTEPTSSYKRHAWIAMAGLLLFVIMYLLLTGWFSYNAYYLIADLWHQPDNFILTLVMGFINAFLAIFMIKALIFRMKANTGHRTYISQEEEPVLFDFLNRLADDAGAPRPHRVFLSHQVNASVSYDLSILNLIFPSKKNLEIGIGLINVLNVGELKAVLAHEFGHFGQRSMLIGRWVYVAQQIAAYLIAKRDFLDDFLSGLSRFDIRVAWVGWILMIIVWSIRSLIESCFRLVLMAELALSREMEFHADLVAVSLTGSDALIHALHKLQAADQALDESIDFINLQLSQEKAVPDLFALQTNIIEQWRRILDQADFGASPELPERDRAQFRVFQSQLAAPPKMWLSHPIGTDREENAKRHYIEAAIDDRSAWDLFSNPGETKIQITAGLIKTAEIKKKLEPLSLEESLRLQNEGYQLHFLDRDYRGVYLNRFTFAPYDSHRDVYTEMSASEAKDQLQSLYPHSLADDIEAIKQLEEEKTMLNALHKREMEPPGGVIKHRGKTVPRKALPAIIEQVEAELKVLNDRIEAHDRICRSVHLAGAKALNSQWAEYLEGLGHLIHYMEHSIRNLNDVAGKLQNVYAVVTADNRVTSSELARLKEACLDVYQVIRSVHVRKKELDPGKEILQSMKAESWPQMLGDFNLPVADDENINQWLEVIDSWINSTRDCLNSLRTEALEALVHAENQVAKCMTGNQVSLPPAPAAAKMPEQYPTLAPGKERPLQQQLDWWDRFHTATGFFPALARVAAAILIIGATLGVGYYTSSMELYVYNGLDLSINVSINGKAYYIPSFTVEEFSMGSGGQVEIESFTVEGKFIEQLTYPIEKTGDPYVYNVAGAATLLEWSATYGGDITYPSMQLGNERWLRTPAEYIFKDPPDQIRTSSSGITRKVVLSAFGQGGPYEAYDYVDRETDMKDAIFAHVEWDHPNSQHLMSWMSYLMSFDDKQQVIKRRLKNYPNDLSGYRWQMIMATAEEKESLCQEYATLSTQQPDQADYFYLSCRCLKNEKEKSARYREGVERWKNHAWLNVAAGFDQVEVENWDKAFEHFQIALERCKPMGEYLADDLVRVERLSGKRYPHLDIPITRYLHYQNMIESGDDPDFKRSPYFAYTHMDRGRPEEAMAFLDELEDLSQRSKVLRLAAASTGADPQLVEEAVNLPLNQGIDDNTTCSSLGLALRHGQDLALYDSLIRSFAPVDYEKVMAFIDAIKRGDTKSAEGQVQGMSMWTKGQTYTIGIVALEDKAPEHWKFYAMKVLFPNERPYFELSDSDNS